MWICGHTKPSLTAETPHLSCNGFAARLPNSDDIPVPQIDPSCAAFSQLQTNDACDETASVETHPSAGIFHTTRFADYGDAYLSREFSSCGNFAANLAGKFRGLNVWNSFRIHDNAKIAPGLNRHHTNDTVMLFGYTFEILKPLHVIAKRLLSRTRAGRGNGIGSGAKDAVHATVRLRLSMMRGDSIAHLLVFTINLQELSSKKRMRPFLFTCYRLADIMKETDATSLYRIESEFGRHGTGQKCDFHRMAKHVLRERSAILECTHQGKDLTRQADHTCFNGRSFRRLGIGLCHFITRGPYGILNGRRVDAPIRNQRLQRTFGYFAANRIES